MLFYGDGAILVAALVASSCTPIHAFSLPRNYVAAVPSLASASSTTLSLAFGLPDEDRQLTPLDDTVGDDGESSVSDETLQSLVEKLDKSKDAAAAKTKPEKDNKSMAFLKKIGRVGGAANKSFVNAVGSDEGSTGRQPPVNTSGGVSSVDKKARLAYQQCTVTGIVDDLSEAFPLTSSGTEWRGVTDRVMGGRSNGLLKREPDLNGRPANVLVGRVSLANNGGFLQMVTDLPLDASDNSVDASDYDGIEFDMLYRPVISEDGEDDIEDANPGTFNMHVRTPGTLQQASYRHTFRIQNPDTWETFRVPFSSFEAYGGESDMPATLDPTELRRIGIVGIGREMDVFLAMGGVRFYSVI